MRFVTPFIFVCFITSALACGSVPKPEAQVTESKSDISAAEAVGAQNYPKAALHLKMAKDQVTLAERLIAGDENEEANLVLQRAEADAELALALANEEKLQGEAREALQKVEQLKQEK